MEGISKSGFRVLEIDILNLFYLCLCSCFGYVVILYIVRVE